MTTEYYPVSLVNRLALADITPIPQGYYRSKLFIAPLSTHSLVTAAGPLLSFMERLNLSPSLPPIEKIRDSIDHELRAFLCKLDAQHYAADLRRIAHYLISATLDEILGKNYLRIYHQSSEFNAFTPLTSDGVLPEQRFFEIIHFIKERPNQYLDLIELSYYCLLAGFEGIYHFQADGRQNLDNTIEDLYQIIQQYRFNKPYKLFNSNAISQVVKRPYKATCVAAVLATSIIISAFMTSQWMLENKAKTVLFRHTQLAMLEK